MGDEAPDEGVAFRELLLGDPLVRLVRLRDRAGADDHGRDARDGVEQAALRPVGDFRMVVARREALGEDLAQVNSWQRPVFPLKAADLLARGFERGPQLGEKLRQLEADWIASDFTLPAEALLASLDTGGRA